MRAIYLILGLVLGWFATIRYAETCITLLVDAQNEEILAQKLVGFHDGYRRGFTRAWREGFVELLNCQARCGK